MKLPLIPQKSPTRKRLGLLLSFGLGLASMASPSSMIAASIVANFADGTSTTQVDAWTGMAGSGWANAWGTTKNGATTLTNTVSTVSPFPDSGGNYLSTTIKSTEASTTRSGVVGRRYQNVPGGVSLDQSHTISFEFRLDTPLADLDRLYFFDSTTLNISPETAGNTTTWLIRGNSNGGFQVHNGTTTVNATGVTLIQGDVYRFTVDVSPAAVAAQSFYTVRIDNVSTASPTDFYQSGNLAFYSAQTSVGGYLNFDARVLAGKTVTFSLDNIAVIPESSTVALTSAGLVLLGLACRLRKRSLAAG